jgi:TPR repeat protein
LPKAANNLGALYDQGYGVALDRNQAAVWFSKGAEGGDVDAQFNLGSMYWLGHGVRKDIGRAAHWFLLAAQQGHGAARKKLAYLYSNRIPLPAEVTQSQIWAELAQESPG